MLVLLTRVSVNHKTVGGGIVLNTDFMSEIKTHTSGATFKFFGLPENRRGGYDTYVVSETPTLIKAQMNTALNAIALSLSVYPDNNENEDVENRTFKAAEIIQAYPDVANNRTKCWVVVNEKGTNARRLKVAHYYVDLADFVRTGSSTTSTSTTSTTTTSTSTTSTTTTTT